jgi:hypothetical protein
MATFLIPPALALLLANLFHFSLGETAGLFMVGVAPGAPLLTRNIAKQGFTDSCTILVHNDIWNSLKGLAPRARFELATLRLTGSISNS